MNVEARTTLESVQLTLNALEARGLYAELYRLSTNDLQRPYDPDGEIAMVMRKLAEVGADQ